mgnify:CR=1 FL=1
MIKSQAIMNQLSNFGINFFNQNKNLFIIREIINSEAINCRLQHHKSNLISWVIYFMIMDLMLLLI